MPDTDATRADEVDVPPLVVVPCSKTQATRPAPARELYQGTLHMACRRAALALTVEDRVLVLSARYGLLPLFGDKEYPPYNESIPDGTFDPGGHIHRARQWIRRNGLIEERPIILAGRRYMEVARAAWGRDRVVTPLVGCRGIGDYFAVLRTIEHQRRLPEASGRARGGRGRS